MSFEDQEATLQELADFIDSLPPEEQQAAMVSLGLQQANQVPYTFGGDYQPELGAQAFEGAGYTGGYNLPNFTTKGAVDPRDQAQMAASTTFAKNREGLLADNVFSAQAGPGAYAAGAFEPTVAYKGSVVDFPGERTLTALAQTGGWQGAVAQRMLGMTSDGRRRSSAEAMGEIRALMESDPAGLDEGGLALQTNIFQSLNAAKAGSGGGDAVDEFILEGGGASGSAAATKPKTAPGKTFDWSQYDLPGMQQWADERQMELLKDRPREELFQDQTSGAYYDQAPEETPSAQSKWFADRGLTTPDKSYADQAYQEEVLNRQNPNRPFEIQQEQYDEAAGQAATSKLGQQFQDIDQIALLMQQELAKQQQGSAEFVTRQQAQNAPLAPTVPPQRGGAMQAGGAKFPPLQLSPASGQSPPLVPPAPPPQRGGASMAGGPKFPPGPPVSEQGAPVIPRNVQGEPITPGPGKDWAGQPLPSEQDLVDYYAKTFPTNPIQVNPTTGESAPAYDFGAGAGGNAQINEFVNALAQQGGGKSFDVNSGGQKGRVIPGAKTYPSTTGNAAAFRQAAEQARTRYTDQYNSDFKRMYQGPSDFADNYLQRGQMNQMAQQGRTPLNDEIMQRRLLLNALGLYQ